MDRVMSLRGISQSMKKALSEDNYQFGQLMGPEMEVFVFDVNGKPVDLCQHGIVFQQLPGFWAIGTDVGHNMLELAFSPCQDTYSYIRLWLEFCDAWMKYDVARGWRFVFRGTTLQRSLRLAPSRRYSVLAQALNNEGSDGSKFLLEMTRHASFQINIGLNGKSVFNREGLALFGRLNNLAPALAHLICNDLCVERLGSYWRYAGDKTIKDRCPRFFKKKHVRALPDVLLDVSQLVCGQGDKQNIRAFNGRAQYFDPFHLGTMWHWCRVQGVGDKKCERLEFRIFDSMLPEQSVDAMVALDRVVRRIVCGDEFPRFTKKEWTKLHFGKGKKTTQKKIRQLKNMITD